MEEIIIKLDNYIATEVLRQPKRIVYPDEALISSGLIDSFSLVGLSLFIEEYFGIRIDDTELNADTFDTLQRPARLIQGRQ